MKPQFLRVAVLTAAALTSPLIILAGSQPAKVGAPSKREMLDRTGVAKAAQQGKGTGTTRNQGVHANTIPFRPSMIRKPGDPAFGK